LEIRVNQGQELVTGGYTPSLKNFDPLVTGHYDGDNTHAGLATHTVHTAGQFGFVQWTADSAMLSNYKTRSSVDYERFGFRRLRRHLTKVESQDVSGVAFSANTADRNAVVLRDITFFPDARATLGDFA
jgi:hypothetical protein